ncbi:MAG: tetratricopeptide repeat protein [Gemmatimonadetes bacterium]|nr:tetratricopeptide repeat protein [Gemmatimonadota bacterium]
MGTAATPDSEVELTLESLRDWVSRNRNVVIGVSSGLVVLIGAGMFWKQSNRLKADRAESAFMTAQNAFYSGNPALAKTDLEKLVDRYPGTPGAIQARLLLAQIHYGDGKFEDGIKVLSAANPSERHFKAAVQEMLAAGYADSKQPAKAAEHYVAAAEAAPFDADKHVFRADAARMYMAAGDTSAARKIWEPMAADSESPLQNEAKVRLGELRGRAAGS